MSSNSISLRESLALLFLIYSLARHNPHVGSVWATSGSSTQFFSSDEEALVHSGCFRDTSQPDAVRNVTDIIISRGFEFEEYDVITDDGYILSIQRIINPLVKPHKRKSLKPVLLQHGFVSSAVDWIINSYYDRDDHPEEYSSDDDSDSAALKSNLTKAPNSIAFYLANRGYDVWLANSRGNLYGQRHVRLNRRDPQFWSFSFDEQITHDLPATINFILEKLPGRKKLGFVGHSQGSTMALGLLADYPKYSSILEPVIALAPVAFVSNAITPARHLSFLTPLAQHINAPFATNLWLVNFLAGQVCNRPIIRREICANILFLIVGFNEAQIDETRINPYLCHLPSGTSLKNLAHYGQEIRSKRFAHFDHGLLGNLVHRKGMKPLDYPLDMINSTSIALFTAENDWLGSPKDTKLLIKSLKVKLFKLVNMTDISTSWNHIDFIYAKDTGRLLNPKIHEILEEFEFDFKI